MDELITMDDARALVGDAALWPRVRDFLWDFAPQIHRSWLENLDGLENLESLELLESPRLKRYILESLGVAPCFHTFPKGDPSRLLLLDGATLDAIAKWLGALACAASLRTITDGATVRALRAALPGVYPEVFQFAAYFDFGSRRGAEEAEAQRIVEEGYKMLFSLLADLPEALQTRLKLKLPKSLCASATSAPLREIKSTTLIKLLKLKFPEAYRLCYS